MCHQKGDFFVRKKVLSLLLAFCMIVAPFTVVHAEGTTHKVSTAEELTQALENATNGDTIVLDSGEYLLDQKITISNDLTIQGKENVVIKGNNNSSAIYFEVTSGKVTFDNLTLEGFGGALPTKQGIGVITVPESASDVELTVRTRRSKTLSVQALTSVQESSLSAIARSTVKTPTSGKRLETII